NRLRTPSLSSNSPPLMKQTSPGRALVAWQQETLSNGDVSNVWPELSQALRANAGPTAVLREALQSRSTAFNLNYEAAFSLSLPHLPTLKRAAQWLSMATICELHDGHMENAIDNLSALTAFAQNNNEEPLMISELVRVGVASIAVNTTWEALQ